MTKLTYEERLLLNRLVVEGGQVDHDKLSHRALVGSGYATRHPDPLSGVGMIAATDAGRAAHQNPDEGAL